MAHTFSGVLRPTLSIHVGRSLLPWPEGSDLHSEVAVADSALVSMYKKGNAHV